MPPISDPTPETVDFSAHLRATWANVGGGCRGVRLKSSVLNAANIEKLRWLGRWYFRWVRLFNVRDLRWKLDSVWWTVLMLSNVQWETQFLMHLVIIKEIHICSLKIIKYLKLIDTTLHFVKTFYLNLINNSSYKKIFSKSTPSKKCIFRH